CHLRFDDTNPETEDIRYVESIQDTVRWLGYDWGEHLYFASDYFDRMYEFAEHLIRTGKAYVDSLPGEEIREYRGTVTEPGRESPYRNRSVDESLDMFRRMREGEFPDGAHVLRARIDMASTNMLMRDPVLYRIRHAHHYRTGDAWCIYPLYDYAHPIEDALECVTHSICTLEFENNRPFYDWLIASLPTPCVPHQYEFARGNLEYTVMSKRKLLELVSGGYVSGWDDPRLPTLAGLRRRGFTPEAIRSFWESMGVAKVNSRVDMAKLEFAIRDDLNQKAPRVLCVLDPLRVVITNYPDDRTEELEASYWPHDVPRVGSRQLPFSREIFIDRADFAENPPRGFRRLVPGGDVRLRYAYVIRCDEVIKDESGQVTELRCSYYPETKGGTTPEGHTVKGTIQWVSAAESLPCEVRLYDRLFTVPDPDVGEGDFKDSLNPDSLVIVRGARVEPGVRNDPAGSHYQFERLGYFYSDPIDSGPGSLVFNRTVTLRDTWSKPAAEALEAPRKKRPEPTAPAAPQATATPQPRSLELEARFARYQAELGLPLEEADILTRELAISDFFEAGLDSAGSAKGVANWVIHELPREAGDRTLENLPFGASDLGELVGLVEDGTISGSAGREVLAELVQNGGSPRAIVERKGLRQVSDATALTPTVDAVLAEYGAKADEYRAGKTGLLGFFVGQVMRQTSGKANPALVKELLEDKLR
ncbi:MAG TPA: glutamine--tRNA ligase/YqeY domain fusion protein, partial [Longimicrobiaceae bacterium]|nr:glutamine--tRNA ligase/YqeY domain fusion protein [Longimicrobiaceae bacterium]